MLFLRWTKVGIFLIVAIATTVLLRYNTNMLNPDNKLTLVKNSETGNLSGNDPEMPSLKKDSSKKNDYVKLHYDALLIDTHNDFMWKVFDKGAVFGQLNNFTQSDLPRFRSGGLDAQVFAIWIPMNKVKRSYNFVTSQIERLKNIERNNFEDLEFAGTYDDIIRITNQGKVCGLIGVEGGTAVEKDLNNIDELYQLGVRYIGLTWNNSNLISTSAKDEIERGKQGGLTDYGIQVVRRMNQVGMLIDVSHLSEEGFWGVIENTSDPIIASHSNCYAINPHLRNLTDEQIKAIAKNEGYIGINFHDEFLSADAVKSRTQSIYDRFPEELEEIHSKYANDQVKLNEERDKLLYDKKIFGGTTIDKIIDHIDHIKNLVGIDYVGIGSDFDGGITPPADMYDVTCYPLLTKRLLEKGYKEDEIKKILGLNFLRVFQKVCS